ncbi:helix-turn-helix domain-containing protein [Flagellimonas eckloniae]|uniref:AraC family transcriptional regulator n=1 Tax=Flagellimonas eckloniae TaxID=346185 RepID=A0A0Q1BGH9_9FLAO|nr:helix-turn-helix transcriptional regulator [Allomuricauda eckloniae]KQC29462.1 AraC family transcriptional regulator [Allomuricauda eckloniae]
MTQDHKSFKYKDFTIVEKLTVSTPLKYEAIFQDKGCFIYFKNGNTKLLSSEHNTEIKGKEAVLLKCGSNFLEVLQNNTNEELETIVIHLFPELLKEIYKNEIPTAIVKRTESEQSLKISSNDLITKFIDSLEFYFDNPSLVNNDLLELKVKELLLLLIQTNYIDSVQELITDLYSVKTIKLNEVVTLHTFSNLSVNEMAKLCNMSLSSFKRAFKTFFNDSPNNYLNTKKIEKAKELLQISELNISDIAYETGFNDPQYFTRLFKKRIGLSPSEFRSQHTV